jgi:hypothetical protein
VIESSPANLLAVSNSLDSSQQITNVASSINDSAPYLAMEDNGPPLDHTASCTYDWLNGLTSPAATCSSSYTLSSGLH